MKLSNAVIERIVDAVSSGNVKCVPLSELVPAEEDMHLIVKELMKIRSVFVYYSIPEDEYYVCRRERCRRITIQDIVDELREKYNGEPVPKPEILDFLKERIPTKYEALYNMLLNDGVLEEINISGMILVKIVK